VNNDELLERVAQVPGYEYNYHHDPYTNRMGPMADDYSRQFGGSPLFIDIPPWLGLMWTTLVALAQEVRAIKLHLGGAHVR